MGVEPDDKLSAWRWLAFIILFVLFPIVFRPWWLAIISIAAFILLMNVVFPGSFKSK